MPGATSAKPILVLTYSDSAVADLTLCNVAMHLVAAGWRLAGLVQHNEPRPGRSRCDMTLEELASGHLIPISEDRGPHARGCRLAVDQLLAAISLVESALEKRPDLVILNRFGKTEAEGGGFRGLIVDALEAGIPILIAVPYRNLDNWHAFAGELSSQIDLQSGEDSFAEISAELNRMCPSRPTATCDEQACSAYREA